MLLCYVQGYKLSEVVGEITAYRYFYSLRMAFGQGESPWVPNGHTIGYAYLVLNKLLNLVGFDWHEVKYRIDLALVLMNLLSYVLTGWLLVLVFLRPARPLGALLAALLGLSILFQQSLNAGMFIYVPDYPVLILPMALAAVAIGLPLIRGQASWRSGALIIVYGTLCLATKLTFVAFYAPLALLFLYAANGWGRRIIWLIALALLPVAGALFFLYAYHAFSWDATAFNLSYILDFLRNSKVSEPELYSTWLARILHQHWQTASFWGYLAVLAPYLIAVATLILPHRHLSASFLLFSAVGHALIFSRPHSHSFIEVNFYLYAYVILYLVTWGINRKPTETEGTAKWNPWLIGPYLACTVVLAWLIVGVARGQPQIVARVKECNLTGRQVAGFVQSAPGRTLFLIPNNSYALPALDSAISKGGTDMHSNTWGDSKLMANLFPDKTYLFGYSPLPARYDLTPFNKLVFTVILNDYAGDIDKLKTLFGVTLEGFTRTFDYEINSSVRVLGYVRNANLLETQRPAPAGELTNRPLIVGSHGWSESTATDPIPGFTISPAEAGPTVTIVREEGRTFIRLTATRESSYLSLTAAIPAQPEGTGPVEVTATVRTGRPRLIATQIYDVTAADGSADTSAKSIACPANQWTTQSVRRDSLRFPHSSDNFSVGLLAVGPGDVLDVAVLELSGPRP